MPVCESIRAIFLTFCREQAPCEPFLRGFFCLVKKPFCHPISLVLPKETGVAPQRKARRSQRRARNLCNLSPLQPLPTGARATERQRQRNAAKDRQGRRGGRAQPPPEQNSARPPQRARQGAEIKSWGARGESKQPTGAAHSDAEGARSDRAVITAGCRQTTGGYHVRGIPYFGGAENAAVNPFVSGYDYV